MKTILTILLSLVCFSGAFAQCEAKQIAKSCKPNMKPYKYDAYGVTELNFGDKEKKVEITFSVYEGQNYKLVFCSSGFAEEVKLNIYDKSKAVKSRQPVFNNSEGIDNNFWSFEPGTYYIEYDVPKSATGTPHKGCVVFLIGFK
jgi:hypothetical protein